jgi:subtilisin family serine protease
VQSASSLAQATTVRQSEECPQLYSTNEMSMSGTSFSTPLVSGILATYISFDQRPGQQRPSRESPAQYAERLRQQLYEQATRLSVDCRSAFIPDRLAYSFPPGYGVGQ